MSRILLLLSVLLFSMFATNAQSAELYHRVKVNTGTEGLRQMAAQGIAVDHGELKKGVYFISDLSDSEIEILKALHLNYEVLIQDVSAYYIKRNNDDVANKTFDDNGCINCPDYAKPLNFNYGSMGGFYTYQEMEQILDSMHAKYPNLITAKQSIGSYVTNDGNTIWYVKISDNPNVDENEPEVLYTALHHAREVQSLSQLVYYMWYILENYGTNQEITHLIDNRELYFIPCVNPDGYKYNYQTNPAGGGMWRKNRANNGGASFGVDLNRNYGSHWGYDNVGSSPNSTSETYRGTAAFSENETKAVRDFCNGRNFRIALNAHTFSNLLIYPYGFVASLQTPDSNTFQCLAEEMVSCSGFLAGTGDQTVGYVTNGDSDDWMYEEQTTRNKIFALTPEAGSTNDGFWPTISRIIPIAKNTMEQNLYLARLAGGYAELKPTPIASLPSIASYVHYNFKRTGLDSGTYTVSLLPISSNIAQVGTAKTYINPALNNVRHDSISISLNGSVGANDQVVFALRWSHTSGSSYTDTITTIFSSIDTVFYSDCNTLDSFTNNGWGVSTTQFVSSTGSVTESPSGNYTSNANKSLTTKNFIDLTDASAALITYKAKWQIEKGYDYMRVQIAKGNGSYTTLCAMYTHPGTSNQNNVTAVYDGIQNDWVTEKIDISAYAGDSVKIRFVFVSDGGVEMDGFYLDDLTVLATKKQQTSSIAPAEGRSVALFNSPNPSRNTTIIHYQLNDNFKNPKLMVTDVVSGRMVISQAVKAGNSDIVLDISQLTPGIYFYKIVSDNAATPSKKMVVVQ